MKTIEDTITTYANIYRSRFLSMNLDRKRIIFEKKLLDISYNDLAGSTEEIFESLKNIEKSLNYTSSGRVSLTFDHSAYGPQYFFVEQIIENDEEYNARIEQKIKELEIDLRKTMERIAKNEINNKIESFYEKRVLQYINDSLTVNENEKY